MHLLVAVHHSLSVTSVLASILWAIIVFAAPRRAIGLGKVGRLVHFGAIAATGLYGVTGVVVLAARMKLGWGILLACVVIAYGFAGRAGRLALAAGRKVLAVRTTLFQLTLIAAAIIRMPGLAM